MYFIWKLSGYIALPFPGGWMAQPEWVTRNLLILMRRDDELNTPKKNQKEQQREQIRAIFDDRRAGIDDTGDSGRVPFTP